MFGESVMATELTIIEFIILYGMTIFFTANCLHRKSPVMMFLSGICWITCGYVNFYLGVSAVFIALSYIFMILGGMFLFAFIFELVESISERKERRVESVTL